MPLRTNLEKRVFSDSQVGIRISFHKFILHSPSYNGYNKSNSKCYNLLNKNAISIKFYSQPGANGLIGTHCKTWTLGVTLLHKSAF